MDYEDYEYFFTLEKQDDPKHVDVPYTNYSYPPDGCTDGVDIHFSDTGRKGDFLRMSFTELLYFNFECLEHHFTYGYPEDVIAPERMDADDRAEYLAEAEGLLEIYSRIETSVVDLKLKTREQIAAVKSAASDNAQ